MFVFKQLCARFYRTTARDVKGLELAALPLDRLAYIAAVLEVSGVSGLSLATIDRATNPYSPDKIL